MQLKTNKIHWF